MKQYVVISIVLALLFLAIVWVWNLSLNVLKVENVSGKLAQKITIQISGNNYYLDELPPGESKRINFKVTGDSGFNVNVSFDDGSQVSGEFGYVTGGTKAYNNKVKVKIFSDRIEGTQE